MKGFKVFNPDWTTDHCDIVFEVGRTYRTAGKPVLCAKGFHFCEDLLDCFGYYDFDDENHVCAVIATGDIESDGVKSCTNEITLVREIPWDEVSVLVNGGDKNELSFGPSTPAAVLYGLANDGNASVRCIVAENPLTPEESLRMLAGDADEDVRSSVAANPSTPQDVLLSLAKDPNTDVRFDIAGNPSAPAKVLWDLVYDEALIRKRVAANVAAPDEAMRILASSADPEIRCAVAGNTSAPDDVLAALAADNDWRVRNRVAKNTSARPCMLLLLAVDLYSAVRLSASNNPSFPDSS